MAPCSSRAGNPDHKDCSTTSTGKAQQVTRLGVEVRISTPAEVEEILTCRPNAILLATGAEPDLSGRLLDRPSIGLPGVDSPHVLSSVDLLGGQYRSLGSEAVVFDEVGHYEGIGVPEFLLERGLGVTYVTSRSMLGAAIASTLRFLRRSIDSSYAKPLRIQVETLLVEIGHGQCVLQSRSRPTRSGRGRRRPGDTQGFTYRTSGAPARRRGFDLRDR